MKEKHKISNYPSKNKKTETYKLGDTLVTKNFYDAKDAYVRELINEENGIKEVKHFTVKGVLAKLEHFVEDKRHGQEIKYLIAKANESVKSTKMYDNGKLHGENITYNENAQIIKHEVFADGKLVLKYLREDTDSNDITNVQIVNKENVENLPKEEYEKLQSYL
jgi:antitoxin component YwqK of YwqJK toxin-antitoxin module